MILPDPAGSGGRGGPVPRSITLQNRPGGRYGEPGMVEVRYRIVCQSAAARRAVAEDMTKWMDARAVQEGAAGFVATVTCIDGDEEGIRRHIERTYGESVVSVEMAGGR